ncbi:MAG: OB-fold domain-containing protein [Sphingopyxis sp.]|nr:OB-fold domain-containing protein [Sphingopyxis sp.]
MPETASVMPDLSPEERFLDALEAGRIEMQFDPRTGRDIFPPRSIVPGTGEVEIGWRDADPQGTIYSATIIRDREGRAQHMLVLVDLAGGARLMGQIAGGALGAAIGTAVRARAGRIADQPAILFDVAETET